MSKVGVKYRLSDSLVLGIVQVSIDGDLVLNYDPTTEGMIEVPSTHPVLFDQLQWHVASGDLVRKSLITASVNRSVILANGVDEAVVTFEGLSSPAQVRIDGCADTAIDPADPMLVITSDTPRRFVGQILDETQWSNPFTVEAV